MRRKTTFCWLLFIALIANGCIKSETHLVADKGSEVCEITDWHVNNLSDKFTNLLAARRAPTKDKKRIEDFHTQDRQKALVHPFQLHDESDGLSSNAWVAYDYYPKEYFDVLPLYYQDYQSAMTIVGWDVLIADDCEVIARQVINFYQKNDERKFLRLAAHWNLNRNFVVEPVRVLPVSEIENKTHIGRG